MAAVWYNGTADQRVVYYSDWVSVGIQAAATVTWNVGNGWSVPESSLTSAQLAYLDTLPEFLLGQADGPRTGFPNLPQQPFTQTVADARYAGKREVREYLASQSNIPTPTGIAGAYLTVIYGGGGGGSGRRGAATTARTGGGGASGAALYEMWVPGTVWGSTYSVTVGTGGNGGAAATANDTNGSTGSTGGTSLISTGSFPAFRATGAGGGAGGNATGASGGSGSAGYPSQSAAGGNGNVANAVAPTWVGVSPGAGGGGGPITAADVAMPGAPGGAVVGAGSNQAGTGGVVGGALPSVGPNSGAPFPGAGGGGGAASITSAAQAGANGGFPGGAGGGGGASLNGFNSGKGGDGADGYVRITFVYA